MSPAQIIERYKKQMQKTVLIEYVLSGESLYSFLEVLKDAATQHEINDMSKAFLVFMLQGDSAGCFEKSMETMHGFNVEKHLLNGEADKFMLMLSRADAFDDRVVPNYQHKDWTNTGKDPQKFTLSTNTKLLQFLLLDDAYKAKKK